MVNKSKKETRQLKNRFRELLAKKESDEGKRYNQREIAEQTGLSTATVGSYLRNEPKRYEVRVIEILCLWLGIEPSEFLAWRDVKEDVEEEQDDLDRMPRTA